MPLGRTCLGHVDRTDIDAAVIVGRIFDVVGEEPALDEQGVLRIGGRNAKLAPQIEGVGEGGPFDKRGVQAAGQFFERLEAVVLTDDNFHRAGRVRKVGVEDFAYLVHEAQFHLIAEPAGDIPRCTQTRTPDLVSEPVVHAGRCGGIYEPAVQHQPSMRFEAPAVILALAGRGRCALRFIRRVLRHLDLADRQFGPRLRNRKLRTRSRDLDGRNGIVLRVSRARQE